MSSNETEPTDRLHGLDALRGSALLLGVVLHASLSYFPVTIWIVPDTDNSPVASATFFAIHLFRMTTFFLIAGLFEARPLGRPARPVESASALNDAAHLALKLQQFGLSDRVRDLRPPRPLAPPATRLHDGGWEAAGVTPDAKARIDALCQAWAEDTGEPFVTLVSRRGVIVTHRAFGSDASGEPISLDYR